MILQTDYLGNITANDFQYYGQVEDNDDSVMIKMPKKSTGGVISSNFYIWYGNVKMKFKTSHNAGVVSAAILFSQVEDEIDFEWVGSELDTTETNFYYEGILDYHNGNKSSSANTYEDFHVYEIDWTQDEINWLIDGSVVRTLKKDDTLNSTSNKYEYPQTPTRVQLSIWPGGAADSPEGTREWAGGYIDWDASDFSDPGYLYVAVDTVEVTCYDPPSTAQTEGNKKVSYRYDGKGYDEENVIISDKGTVIKDLGRTGFNTGEDQNDNSSSKSSIKSSSTSKSASSSSSSLSSNSASSTESSSSSKSSKSSSSASPSSSSSSSASLSSKSSSSASLSSSSSSETSVIESSSSSSSVESTSSSTPAISSTSTPAVESTASSSTAHGFIQDTNTLSASATASVSSIVSVTPSKGHLNNASLLGLLIAFVSHFAF
ncbi:hypothetical protein CAS74_003524 [Pichia kudriavzevii]|uniref:GH16 domain-containing protein n=1 Tax=Pichia kudriavzevii TaxID=4909 RepID=A0A1Z8JLE3_PICKU|nr:hypothetical protein CAS74_003524 [Pichia kudriavzevii]